MGSDRDRCADGAGDEAAMTDAFTAANRGANGPFGKIKNVISNGPLAPRRQLRLGRGRG
jgi:hypothetical protein